VSGEGALSGRRSSRSSRAFDRIGDTAEGRAHVLAVASSAVFEAFRQQLEAGQLPRQQHASLRQLEAILTNFPGRAGADREFGVGGSAGERPSGPSEHGAGGQAVAARPTADSSREARP
jgi:hypothetical protein